MKFLSVCVLLLVLASYFELAQAVEKSALSLLFDRLQAKRDAVRNMELMAFMKRQIPSGIDPPNPGAGDGTPWKEDDRVHFITSGNGALNYRALRRISLNSVLGSHPVHFMTTRS